MQLFHVRQVEMFQDHTSFDSQFDNTDDGIYKINQVYLTQQKLKQTFNDYQISFDIEYPVKKNEEDYRYLNFLNNIKVLLWY